MSGDEPTAPMTPHAAAAPKVDRLPQGAKFGRYVVINRVASGGAGTVYVAYDSVLDRRVALKRLRGANDDGDRELSVTPGWARLVREARMIAKLNHPGVVTVYDAGSIDGSAYIAMELVEGRDLSQWIDDHRRKSATDRRGWREAVKLLLQAGDGLAAAHAASVIHGDFKPANVLVDERGRAKVTDFGIARVGQHAAPRSHALSSTSATPLSDITADDSQPSITGTPAYMAPEQFAGEDSDELSDQYALCCTMYEAVYGRRPHDGATIAELAVQKAGGDLPRPEQTDAPAWVFDVISRGLQRDPQRRYGSVMELLGTIRRRLRPRRWPWIALGMLGVGSAAAAMALTTAPHPYCRDVDAALGGVWDEGQRAAVEQALMDTPGGIGADMWTRVHRKLDAHAQAWAGEFRAACEAADRSGSSDLSRRSFACLRRGRTELSALVDALARAQGTQALRAVGAADRLSAPQRCADPERLAKFAVPDDPDLAQRVEAIRTELAGSSALHGLGDYAGSTDLAQRAVEDAKALQHKPVLAEALHRVGIGQTGIGEYAASKATLEEAYYLATELDNDALAGSVASSLAHVHHELDTYDDGLHWVRLARIELNKAGEHQGELLVYEAALVESMGKTQEAAELQRRALAVLESEGAGAEVIAAVHNDLGNSLRTAGEFEEALGQFEHARELDAQALGEHHPNTVLNLIGIGGVYINTGRWQEATEVLEQAETELTAALGADHPQVAVAISNLAIAYGEGQDYKRAIEALGRVAAIDAKVHGPDSLAAARTRLNRAVTLMRNSEYAAADAELTAIRPIYERELPADHPEHTFIFSNIGNVAAHQEQYPRALEALARADRVATRGFPENHPHRVSARARYGEVLVDAGRPAEAIPILEEAIPTLGALPGLEGRLALSRFALARALKATGGDRKRARELVQAAIAFMAGASPEDAAPMHVFDDAL